MKHFKLVEHNLIPLSLIVLNLSVVHVIYQASTNHVFSIPALLIAVCTILLSWGVFAKNKFIMLLASILSLVTLILSL